MSDSIYKQIDGAISRIVHDLVTPPPLPEQELQLALRDFGDTRLRTLELACNITSAEASFQPAPKSWSIAEILDHLLLTEQSYRVQIQRLIDLARSGKGNSLDLSLKEMNASIGPIPRDLISLFETPLRMMNPFIPHAVREAMIRFPVIAAINPNISDPARKDIALVRTELMSSLDATKAMLTVEMPARLTEMTVTHPILGTNNVVKILRLMSAHEERHHGQIRAVLKNPKLPK